MINVDTIKKCKVCAFPPRNLHRIPPYMRAALRTPSRTETSALSSFLVTFTVSQTLSGYCICLVFPVSLIYITRVSVCVYVPVVSV